MEVKYVVLGELQVVLYVGTQVHCLVDIMLAIHIIDICKDNIVLYPVRIHVSQI